MSTPAQKLAQKENYALFQLTAMLANTHHLRNCPTLNQGDVSVLATFIRSQIQTIKQKQTLRKELRNETLTNDRYHRAASMFIWST